MNLIEIQNLHFEYVENQPVLTDVNLTIQRGEWVTILGHNGSGKSTLSKLIIGLLKAKQGTIKVDGTLLTEETVYDIRRKIGIVFQNPDNQFVGVNVEDDIAFGMENLCFDRDTIIERIKTFAEKVHMEDYLHKEPHNLSGGQKQRVAIAGILAMDTEIIIFDEATSMLDPKGRDQILDYIRAINKDGVTVISITHDMKEAIHADRIVILKEGRILKHGTAKEILLDKATLNASNLELLLPLKLLYQMEENHIEHPTLKEHLWQLSLNK